MYCKPPHYLEVSHCTAKQLEVPSGPELVMLPVLTARSMTDRDSPAPQRTAHNAPPPLEVSHLGLLHPLTSAGTAMSE